MDDLANKFIYIIGKTFSGQPTQNFPGLNFNSSCVQATQKCSFSAHTFLGHAFKNYQLHIHKIYHSCITKR